MTLGKKTMTRGAGYSFQKRASKRKWTANRWRNVMAVSRRNFVKGLAGAGIVGAAAGLAACSPEQGQVQNGGNSASGTGEGSARPIGYMCDENWLGEAPAIADADIAETHTFDVVIVGGGHAGTQAALGAAQEGASVAVIEKHDEDNIVYRGDDICSYNSKLLESWGFGPYDLEDITNEYVRRAAGRCNSEVIRTFVYNSGEMMDNLVSLIPETSNLLDRESAQCIVQVANGKPSGADYPINSAGYKQWASTLQTLNSLNEQPVGKNQLTEVSRLTELEIYSRDAAEELGAQWFFGQSALVCTQVEDGTVTGVIAEDASGAKTKFEASKAVILATGDFGANPDMVFELCSESGEYAERNGIPRESLLGMTDCDGSGHKMGCWAGGAIEGHPRPVAGSAPVVAFGPWGSTPCLWMNCQGYRFMNEECSALLMPQSIKQPISEEGMTGNFAVMDAKYMQYVEKCGIDHGSPNWGLPSVMERLKEQMSATPENGSVRVTTTVIASYNEMQNEMLTYDVFVGDTLEEAFTNAGLSGESLENALATTASYNDLCAAGADTQFGKSASIMIPIDEAPFYVAIQPTAALYGPGLNTLAGLCVTGNYEVRTMDKSKIIPGLYAVGNTMGERYGNSYGNPSAGNNMGNALTSGRVAGKHAAHR